MKEPIPDGAMNRWKGVQLRRFPDVERVCREFGDDRVFVLDNEGRLLEIDGGENSPVEPIVKFTEWQNFGKDDEKPLSKREGVLTFLARQPKVADINDLPIK